jgi:hypothetical protein
MILYYTGASNNAEAQTKINLSLGNYVSSSLVPSGHVGATLRDVTRLTKQNNKKYVFMLALKNTTGSLATDVTIYYDYPTNNQYRLELAFVSPSTDLASNEVYEKILNTSSLPITGTFAEYSSVGNAVNIGNIANGVSVGVWFKATLIPASIVAPTCDALYAAFLAEEEEITEQEINFSISYT